MQRLSMVVVLFSFTHLVSAQTTRTIKVDVNSLPPCVMKDAQGNWTGFEVELLRMAAQSKGYSLTFREVPNFERIFDGLKKREADVAVAGITINSSREREVDFTHPTVHSSVGMMVVGEQQSSVFRSVLFWLNKFIPSLLVALFVMVVFGNLLWLVERGSNKDFHRNYYPGVFEGMWYVFIAITTVGFGDKMARSVKGRVLTALIVLIGLGVAANLVADISAFKIIRQLDSNIQKPRDLAGRWVATVKGTTSEAIIKEFDGMPVLVDKLSEALQLLSNQEVEAVVFDEPTLRHYEQKSRRLFTLEGLKEQDYAISIAQGNHALREVLNKGILELRENGTYDILKERFFKQ